MKKFLKRFFIFLLIVLLGIVAGGAIFLKSKLNMINYEDLSSDDIGINDGIDERLKGYTNIVLFGLDTLDNTFANSRSDCIMIFSLNNSTKDVKIVSVYRDTYLQIEGHGLEKVTHAYAYNKAPLALNTINTNLDLNVTKYVTINFDSVIKIVDAVGGVKIDVTSAEAGYIPGISGAGTYNLTGEQALAYGRIRKIDSDYVRTERMRTVVIKIFEKIKGLSYSQINDLIDTILPKVATNISQTEIISYASKIKQYNIKESFGWPYDIRGITLDLWYGVPVTLESNVKKLHEELFDEENVEVSDTVKNISSQIINRTGYSN